MNYISFLDIAINILFFLIGTGCLASLIGVCAVIGKTILSSRRKTELPKAQTTADWFDSPGTLTEREIEELLLHVVVKTLSDS
jgi:hypothetical protein